MTPNVVRSWVFGVLGEIWGGGSEGREESVRNQSLVCTNLQTHSLEPSLETELDFLCMSGLA